MNSNVMDIILLVHPTEDLLLKESNGDLSRNNIGRIRMYEKVVVLMVIDIRAMTGIKKREIFLLFIILKKTNVQSSSSSSSSSLSAFSNH